MKKTHKFELNRRSSYILPEALPEACPEAWPYKEIMFQTGTYILLIHIGINEITYSMYRGGHTSAGNPSLKT